jgi:hypothetical protein
MTGHAPDPVAELVQLVAALAFAGAKPDAGLRLP